MSQWEREITFGVLPARLGTGTLTSTWAREISKIIILGTRFPVRSTTRIMAPISGRSSPKWCGRISDWVYANFKVFLRAVSMDLFSFDAKTLFRIVAENHCAQRESGTGFDLRELNGAGLPDWRYW